MNDESINPSQQDVPSAPAPDSEFMKKFEEVIMSYAEATSAGKEEEAQLAGMQALYMAAAEQLRNPSPDVELMNEADALESEGDWAGAEVARRKVLALEEASGNFGMIAKAQMDLCRLLRVTGRNEEAGALAAAATSNARRTKCFPVIVTALISEASCALARGDSAGALAATTEAVQIVEPGKLADHERARALTARARCLLAHGDPAGAQLDLTSAWEFLKARANFLMMAGIRWTVANWWEVKSGVEERLGNTSGARGSLTTAIDLYRMDGGPHARLALARAIEKLAEIARKDGDQPAAEQSLREAKSIHQALRLPAGPPK